MGHSESTRQAKGVEQTVSRKNDIENKLKAMEGGAFQKLAESYVYRKLKLTSLTAIGSQKGTDKVTRGVPDAHSIGKDGAYLIAFTTDQSGSFKKIFKDVEDCLKLERDTNHPLHDVCKIVCCHTCWKLQLWEEQTILSLAPGRVELLGPATMVEDMLTEYADLAWDYLGVPVGNGSLLTLQAFIDAENRREYTTPHTLALRGRQDEIDALVKLIEGYQAVLVTGASGLGKTRLALEAVREYSEKCHCESFVIDSHSSRGVSADANQFLKSGRAVVLVDDVDQLVDLRPLLQIALLNAGLKLVFTARNYAMGEVEKAMRGYVKTIRQTVAPLDKAEISSLLKEDLGIKNQYYIDQIERVAKGNLRLAIMAGIQGKEHGYPAISNAYSILQLFFSGLSDHFADDEVRILEEFSLNGVSDLVAGDWAFDRITKRVCESRQLFDSVEKLSSMSILDVMVNNSGTRAVRYEQQNLRDYCVYRALMVDRIIPLCDYIRAMIDRSLDTLCASLNTLLGSFSCEETVDEVKCAARDYWRSLPTEDAVARRAAMEVLHRLLEPYDLEYVRRSIEDMAEGTIPTGKDYQHATIGPVSLPMKIVCETKGSPRWPAGMDLLVALLEKGGDTVGSYKLAFERLLAPDEVSAANDYRDECDLLSRLIKKAQEGAGHNIMISLLELCELYLRVQFESVESGNDSNSFTIKSWRVPYSDALRNLRSLSIEGLTTLCLIPKHRKEAVRILCACFSAHSLDRVIERDDIDSLACCLQERPELFRGEDSLLYSVQESCAVLGLCYGDLFDIEASPEYVMVCNLYGSNPMDKYLDSGEKLKSMSIANLEAFLTYCGSSLAAEQFDKCKLHYVIDCVMLYIVESAEKEQTLRAFESYCESDVQYLLSPQTLTKVICACGYSNVRRIALKHELGSLVAEVDGLIPAGNVSEQTVSDILLSQRASSVCLRADDVSRIDSIMPGFARRFWNEKERLLLDNPLSAERFLDSVGYQEDAHGFLERMIGDNTASLNEFFFSHMNEPMFDVSGAIFEFLFLKSPDIVEELIQVASTGQGLATGHAIERLGYLSKLPKDSFESLGRAIDCLTDSAQAWLVSSLLSTHNPHLQDGFPISNFIVYYITTRWDDLDRVDSLANVMGDLPAEVRFDIYSKVFAQIPDEKMLELLPVYPTSFYGNGSDGFVPQFIAEIEALKKLSSELSSGAEYVAHQVRIEEMINSLDCEMKNERWKCFHGRH